MEKMIQGFISTYRSSLTGFSAVTFSPYFNPLLISSGSSDGSLPLNFLY